MSIDQVDQPRTEDGSGSTSNQIYKNGLWRGYIKHSRLFPLVHSSYQTMSRVVIFAFVEQCYPETTTFHMLFEEMITMFDNVSTLFAIPVVGNTISLILTDNT